MLFCYNFKSYNIGNIYEKMLVIYSHNNDMECQKLLTELEIAMAITGNKKYHYSLGLDEKEEFNKLLNSLIKDCNDYMAREKSS